jgi:antirestriction protein ArdC
MSNRAVRSRAGQDRASLYDEITDKIIAELEAGRVPWVQPWGTAAAKAPLAMPKNASTARQYTGVNILILWGSAIERGFSGQSWLTFRQAHSLGAHVRKGERGTTVVYADRFVPSDEKQRAAETGEEAQAIPFLKRFTVFNTDQCADLPDEIATTAPPPPPDLIEPRVEALIKAIGITFRIGGDRAFYAPAADYIQVPPPQAYFEPINWHRTALHELGHYAVSRIMPNFREGGWIWHRQCADSRHNRANYTKRLSVPRGFSLLTLKQLQNLLFYNLAGSRTQRIAALIGNGATAYPPLEFNIPKIYLDAAADLKIASGSSHFASPPQ